MSDQTDVVGSLLPELRRGVIVLGVLSQLGEPQYGYSLMERLNDKGMAIDAGTLYPLLRRLEKQGLLQSEWVVSGAKPRKYYRLSETGLRVYRVLCNEWTAMADNMGRLINEERSD